MTPLTTKAAEIRAGLVARARAYRPYNALNDGALVSELLALIEQQAAELAAKEQREASLRETIDRLHRELSAAVDRAEATESERDELLREKERLEREVERLTPKPAVTDEQRAQERERQRLVGEAQNSPAYWRSIYPDGNFPEGV